MKRLFNKSKNKIRQVRHARVRARVSGTSEIPRLSVFRGLRNLTLQLIDDVSGKTLCGVSGNEIKKPEAGDRTGKVAVAFAAGKLLAEKAQAKKITKVVFDRGGYKYHGRVAAAADGAREGGLDF
jgi:large subunit ribosomal protein L18